MGLMNLLKANWYGKVGQTVGAKWKNKSTIRSFTKPAYTDTPAQQTIRTGFAEVSSFCALFTDQLKSLSPLDVRGKSIRNAIIQLNKEMVADGALDAANLAISRGVAKRYYLRNTGTRWLDVANCVMGGGSWATITEKARVVVVFAAQNAGIAFVGSALNSAQTLSIPATVPPATTFDVYHYVLDYRGSTKVGSPSVHTTVTSPAARTTTMKD